MDATTREVWQERSERTGEMLALLEAFLGGRATREDILRWAEALRPTAREGLGGAARAVFPSLLSVDEVVAHGPDAGRFLVREQDIAAYVREVREGQAVRQAEAPLAIVRRSIEEVAAQVGSPTMRYWLDGLGWQVTLRFASLATGRAFLAEGTADGVTMQPDGSQRLAGPPVLQVALARHDRGPAPLADLLDTLGVDLDDLVPGVLPPPAEPQGRWTLWRQDDNGHKVAVQTFSGLAKARAHLRRFEALHHRQIYWLEEHT